MTLAATACAGYPSCARGCALESHRLGTPGTHPHLRQSGFTLIELSIVIAIAAVVLGAVLALVNTQLENARAVSMRAKMDTIRNALVMFTARHSRLPCPAIESLSTTDAAYGLEAPTPGTCTGATAAGTAMRGMLPFRSLGLAEDDAIDVHAGRLTYMVATAATNLDAESIAGATGTITLHNAQPPALGLNPTGNQINACSTTAGDNGCNGNAIVVVLSHGPNARGAFLPSGKRAPLPDSALELENTDNDEMLVLVGYSENDPVFDDQLLVLTPDLLLAGLIRDGAIRSARAVTNERLQAVQDAAVSMILKDSGAVPVATSLPTLNDGWNSPIIYTQVAATVCDPSATVAFTVRSIGPNRIDNTGAADDIVRDQLAAPLRGHVMKLTGVPCP